ncbi:uncharacterized protein Aud_000637 [Aspergillus udagawae]|uniref:Uncharacterized protein n=1 Tax=Aspergillus udagawae TaxID=91492 RepID=A0A8E0QI92_9EURO|nr:uncharacterized protein Aud_000637 [Aspergillus udagawae]GIC84813.1 hypothetical protein Aud_000637 [Aspergillus udagawae]
MMEVLVTVMPMRIATSPLGTTPMERMNAFGEIVRSRVPYPVDYMQWAASNKMVISVKEVPGSIKLAFLESDAGDNSTFATVEQDADSPWTAAPEHMDESQIQQDTWGTSADNTTGDWDAKDESTKGENTSGEW